MHVTLLLVVAASALQMAVTASVNKLSAADALNADSEAHNVVKRQAEFDLEIDDDLLTAILQCQSAGVTPATGLPLTTVTAAFVSADTDRNGILQGTELLPFTASMRLLLRCANPYTFLDD